MPVSVIFVSRPVNKNKQLIQFFSYIQILKPVINISTTDTVHVQEVYDPSYYKYLKFHRGSIQTIPGISDN